MLNALRLVDHNIFYWLSGHLTNQFIWLDWIWKFFSVYFIYLVPLVFVITWFFFKSEKNHKLMLGAFSASLVAWQVMARFIGLLHFRVRPFANFAGAKEIVFHVPTYSFPSDHAAFLAAITTYFYLAGYKKIGNLMLILTLFVCLARVVVGLHWPSDIIVGWIVGILVALVFWWLRKPIDKWIINPLMWLARKIKLA